MGRGGHYLNAPGPEARVTERHWGRSLVSSQRHVSSVLSVVEVGTSKINLICPTFSG